MNKSSYQLILSIFGGQPGIWFGTVAQAIKVIFKRVVALLILANIAAAISVADYDTARFYVLLWASLAIIVGLLSAVGELAAHKGENKAYGVAGLHFYQKLTGKDMTFYRNNKTGYLTTIFRQHLDSMMLLVRMIRGEILPAVISLTLPAIVLFIADWRVGVVAFLLLALQMAYIFWSSAKVNKYREVTHEIYRKLSGEVADDITNVVAYRAAGNEKGASRRIKKIIDEELVAYWKRRSVVVLLDIPRTILTSMLVAVAFLVVLDTQHGQYESVTLIVLTITYMFQIVRNVDDLPEIIGRHDDLITKLYPTIETLSNQDETITDIKNPQPLHVKKAKIDITDLTFRYADNSAKYVFKNLNLHIKGGEQVGVVGLSGAGKSTLASLLMRFDDAQSGTIAIDGTDITKVAQSDLRANIAYVPQEPLLFHRTIKENIAYHTASASDADIIKAAKAAHAHEFIQELPAGYDTMVGERGVKLSGGQKQRVVIARAVLKKAPIILFDEATSALDSESEHIIQAALPGIIGKHTAIIIAHRLSTVAKLDRIIVMHNGAIAEQGTHKQLLAKKGRYYALWQRQTSQG